MLNEFMVNWNSEFVVNVLYACYMFDKWFSIKEIGSQMFNFRQMTLQLVPLLLCLVRSGAVGVC